MPCEKRKDSYLDSYNVSVDTLKRENPALSTHEIRMKAALQFRPIFHAMEAGSAIENAGEQEYENGGFALTPEGEMYFLNTGQKADQLHMNQRRSSELTKDPTKYSVTDHQTTRLIQYAIAHGATIVRTSFARDGQNNRDIVEYQYDRLTNRGVIKVINTADNRVQHSFNSIKEITRQRSAHLTEVAPSEKVFIFTDVQLQQDKVQSVVRVKERRADRLTTQLFQKDNFESHTTKISERVPLRSRGILTQAVDTTGYAIRGGGRDTHEIIKDVSLFIKNKNAQQEAKDRILNLSVVRGARRLFEKDSLVDRRSGGQTERLTLEKIREKSVRMVEVIEKRHEKMRKEMVTIKLIAETGIAAHAAPLFLASLAEKLPLPIWAVEKSVRRHEKKELRIKIKNKGLRRIVKREAQKDSAKVQPLTSERVEPLRAAKERKRRKKRTKVNREMIAGGRRHIVSERSEWKTQERRVRRGKEKGIKIIATASKTTPSASEKREGREKRRLRRVTKKAERMVEAKKLPKKEKKLWIALAVAAGEFFRLIKQTESNPTNPAKRDQSRQAGPVRPIHETMRKWSNEKMKDKRRKTIAGVQFAWIVWMMLNRVNFLPVASKPAMLVSERRGVKLIHPSGVERERSPWVLLSIIWHLTMLREQGTQNTTNTTNHQMKKRKLLLPQYAVIFAYNS